MIPRIAIAVPGSDGLRDLGRNFNRKRYEPRGIFPLYKYDGKAQKKTIGMMLEESKIPLHNQFVLDYPQNLDVFGPLFNGGNLSKATRITEDTLYGRSLYLGVRNLRNALCSIYNRTNGRHIDLNLFGYSQGSEVIQILLSNAHYCFPINIRRWFESVLNEVVLLASPVHSHIDNTRYCVDDTAKAKELYVSHYLSSLIDHRSEVPMIIGSNFNEKITNVFSVKDKIAFYPKTKTALHYPKVLVSSSHIHTNYQWARPHIRTIFSKYIPSNTEYNMGLSKIPKTRYDDYVVFSLAKEYLHGVSVEGTEEFNAFYYNALGPVDYVRQYPNQNYGTIPLTWTNSGVMHKYHTKTVEVLIQHIVWISATRIILNNINRYHPVFKLKEYLLSMKYFNILTPHMLILGMANASSRINSRGELGGLSSSLVSDIDWLGRDTDPNTGVLEMMVERNIIDRKILPEWLYGWTGGCGMSEVTDFLKQSIKEVSTLQNVIS